MSVLFCVARAGDYILPTRLLRICIGYARLKRNNNTLGAGNNWLRGGANFCKANHPGSVSYPQEV